MPRPTKPTSLKLLLTGEDTLPGADVEDLGTDEFIAYQDWHGAPGRFRYVRVLSTPKNSPIRGMTSRVSLKSSESERPALVLLRSKERVFIGVTTLGAQDVVLFSRTSINATAFLAAVHALYAKDEKVTEQIDITDSHT